MITTPVASVPPELIAPLCRIFTEGIREWSGVTDMDGEEIPCNADTVREFDPQEKITVAMSYLEERQTISGNGKGRE